MNIIPILISVLGTIAIPFILITGSGQSVQPTEPSLGAATSTIVQSLKFYDELMPDGSTCSDGQILKKTGTNDWDCAADNGGAGGGGLSGVQAPGYVPYFVSSSTLASSSVYYATSTGNVGIGTASPGAKLDIRQTGAGSGSNVALALSAGNSADYFGNSAITFAYNTTAEFRHSIRSRHNAGSGTGNALDFYVWRYGTDAAGTLGSLHTMTLENGNVGIGTAAPNNLLTVGTGAASGDVYISTPGSIAGFNIEATNSFYFPSSNLLMYPSAASGDSGNAYTFADASGMTLRQVKGSSLWVGATNGGTKLAGINTDGGAYFASNVGIGTTAPSSTLHVIGAGTTSSTSALSMNNASGTSLLFVRNDGNVGIGTTAPTTALDVASGAIIARGALGVSQTNAAVLQYVANETNLRSYGATAGSGLIAFRVGGGGGSGDFEAMRIDNTGNVGIGTTAPSSTLHVVGTSAFTATSTFAGNVGIGTSTPDRKLTLSGTIGTGISLYNTTAPGRADFHITAGLEGFAHNALGIYEVYDAVPVYHLTTYSQQLFLGGRSTDSFNSSVTILNGRATTNMLYVSSTAPVVIQNGGNVGIGTTDPVAALHVSRDTTATTNGFTATEAQLVLANATIPSEQMHLAYDSSIGTNGSGVISAARLGVAYTNLLLQPEAGNVGIGTTAPSSTLHVVGSTRFSATTTLDNLTASRIVGTNASKELYSLTCTDITGSADLCDGSDGGGGGGLSSTTPFTIGDVAVVSSSGAISTIASSTWLKTANNLSELISTSTARINLGLAIGTNVQAFDADLSTIAGLTPATGLFIMGSSTSWVAGKFVQGSNITITTSTPGQVTIAATDTNSGGTVTTSTAVTANYIPFWGSVSALTGTSTIYSSGTGSNARIGIGTISPSSTFHVMGNTTISATTTIQGKLVDTAGNAYVTSTAAAQYPIQFIIENPTATENDSIFTFRATSTITGCYGVNKSAGDTVTMNVGYSTSRATATSSLSKIFSSNQTITATTTPTAITINGSTTPGTANSLVFFATAASTSQFNLTCYYTTP